MKSLTRSPLLSELTGGLEGWAVAYFGDHLSAQSALAAIDEPAPDTGFAVELTARSPGAPSFLVVGLAAQNTPLGNGCRSLVAMQLAVNFALADGSGIARYPIPIPNAPDLRGVRFTTQGAVWNPSQSPLGSAALSAGLLITIGD